MQEENIKTLSFGCRLNALESEKIAKMLRGHISGAIVVNTCGVTAEGERQSAQAVRKIARENPAVPIFVTGCAATRNPELFSKIPHVIVIPNTDKLNLDAYMGHDVGSNARIDRFAFRKNVLSKQYIQVQNGCHHDCTYCVTRLVRGPAVSFNYTDILDDARAAIDNGFSEIVLTGVDTASYARDGMLIADVCAGLLRDVSGIKRLRLSSLDPASPQVPRILDMMDDPRMMGHIHLSMQSGSDPVLQAMRRRHTADMVRGLVAHAAPHVTFSWDIICGFPGETDELWDQTMQLARQLRPIHIHAFPFSPRPGTVAADMPNQIQRETARERTAAINQLANNNRIMYMRQRIGEITSVLVESHNMARDPHDIPVRIAGKSVPQRTVCDVRLVGMDGDIFVGESV